MGLLLAEGVKLALCEVVTEGVPVPLDVGELDADADNDGVGVPDGDGLTLPLRLALPVALRDDDGVSDALPDRLALDEAQLLAEGLGD